MKLQTNSNYLLLRPIYTFLLSFSLSALFIVIFKTYISPDIEEYFWQVVIVIVFLTTLIQKHAIIIYDKVLYIKNIYGLALYKIPLQDIRTHKIVFQPGNPKNLLRIFGKRYDKDITIIIHADNRKIKFNGHLLSDSGLEAFKRKVRK